MTCPYCDAEIELVTGEIIYPQRPDLHHRKFYLCIPCKAYVGCHPGSSRALGRLANSELRRWKQTAHSYFDPLWRMKMAKAGISKSKARDLANQWLADQMKIDVKKCHIGMFSIEECKRLVEVCEPFVKPK